jgi:hypothetical protein
MDYKKYSLEQLENWVHDAVNGDASPHEIYSLIRSVVKENLDYHKEYHQKCLGLYELLSGHRPVADDEELYEAAIKEREYYEGKDDGMRPWGHSDLEYLANDILTKDRISNFPGEQYTDEELNAMCDKAEADEKKDKVVKWILPVEADPSGEYFFTLPDDLLEAADLKEGDTVEWIDNGNSSWTIRKVTKPLGMDEC